MKTLTCGNCGIVYGMPQEKFTDLKNTGKTFYCPNGCPRCFPKQSNQIDDLNLKLIAARNRVRHLEAVVNGLEMKQGEISRLKKIVIKMESASRRVTRTKLTNTAFGGTGWQEQKPKP